VPAQYTIPNLTYYVQQTEYNCGPTSIVTIADALNIESFGNFNSGGQLRTDAWSSTQSAATQESQAGNLSLPPGNPTDGVAWDGPDNVPTNGSWSSAYPMQDTLNFLERTAYPNFYDVQALGDSPSSSDLTNFEANLVDDTYGFAHPFAANEDASAGFHLPGQTGSGTILHWLAPTGYAAAGATTVYEDPGWGKGKPVSAGSSAFVTAIGGRGYVF
jgi:hypothetical protein